MLEVIMERESPKYKDRQSSAPKSPRFGIAGYDYLTF